MHSIVANLMPASRHQDHTTSPSAALPFVSRHCCVHRLPRPTSVTIAKRPSYRARDVRKSAGDLPDVTSENACDRLARRANHLMRFNAVSRAETNVLAPRLYWMQSRPADITSWPQVSGHLTCFA